VIVMEVKKNKKASYGFNAATEEYGDMIEAGIIDPTKVSARRCRTRVDRRPDDHDRVRHRRQARGRQEDGRHARRMGGGMGGMGGGDMY